MTSVTSHARQYSQRKLRLKRWVFRRLQKTGSDCADVTWCGRPFQTHEAATRKARSPYVDSRVWRTIRDGDEAKRRQCRASMTAVRQRSSVRYDGATPCRHLYRFADVWTESDTPRVEIWHSLMKLALFSATMHQSLQSRVHSSDALYARFQ